MKTVGPLPEPLKTHRAASGATASKPPTTQTAPELPKLCTKWNELSTKMLKIFFFKCTKFVTAIPMIFRLLLLYVLKYHRTCIKKTQKKSKKSRPICEQYSQFFANKVRGLSAKNFPKSPPSSWNPRPNLSTKARPSPDMDSGGHGPERKHKATTTTPAPHISSKCGQL